MSDPVEQMPDPADLVPVEESAPAAEQLPDPADLVPIASDEEIQSLEPLPQQTPLQKATAERIALEDSHAFPRLRSVEAELSAARLREANAAEDEQNNLLHHTFDFALRQEPDRRAGVLRIAKDLGVPTDTVERNFEQFKKSWEISKFDPKKWRHDNPELSRMVLDHPELGTLAVREVEVPWLVKAFNWLKQDFNQPQWSGPATRLEGEAKDKAIAQLDAERAAELAKANAPKPTLFKKDDVSESVAGTALVPFKRAGESLEQMEVSQMQFELMTRRAAGADTYELEKQLLDKKRMMVPRDYGESGLGQVATDIAQAAASQYAVFKDAGIGAVGGAVVGGVIGGVASYFTKKPLVGAGMRVGAGILGKAGAAVGSLRLEAGGAYGELKDAKTDDGASLTEEEARGGALLYGGIAATVELASSQQLLKALGPLGESILAGGGKKAIALVMKDAGFRAIARRVGAEWVKAAAAEGGEEFVQQAAQDAITYLTRSKAAGRAAEEGDPAVTAMGLKPQQGPVVNWQQAVEAGWKGFVGGAGMGGVFSSVHLAQQVVEADKAQLAGDRVAAMAKLPPSPLTRAAPEVVAQMISDAAAKSGDQVTALHVDATAFQRLFQGENGDPATAARELLGEDGPRLLQEALAQGPDGKLEVPLDQYLTRWGGTEAATKLAGDTTTNPALLTPNQLKERAPEIEAQAKAIAEAAEPQPTDSEKRLDSLEEQLIDAGPYSPTEARTAMAPIRAFFRTMSDSFGLAAEELFRDVNIVIEAGKPKVALERVDSIARLSGRAASLVTEGRARERFIDSNTGLLNEKAFNELKSEKPLIGHISVEGVKFLNDNTSHDNADLLYRAVARAIHAIDPLAAKVGGDFAVRVNTPAELEQLVRQVNETVAVKGFEVTGAVGKDFKEAGKAHGAVKQAAETAGKRARPRPTDESGKVLPPEKPLGFSGDVKALAFPKDKAAAQVPEQLSSRVGALSPEEYFKETYVDPKTGVLTAEAWNAIPRKPFIAALDMRGLKLANQDYSEETGDQMIERMGRVAKRIGGLRFDFAHLHGDEYAAQFDNELELELFLLDLEEELKKDPVEAWDREIEEMIPVAVGFWHGIGRDTYENADRDLNERKANVRRVEEANRLEGGRTSFDGGRASSLSDARSPAEGAMDEGRSGLARPEDNQRASGRSDRPVDQRAAGEGSGPGSTSESGTRSAEQEVADQRAEALKKISRMRKDNRELATAFLEYADGKTDKRPDIPWRLEKVLAEYGIVDPEGFSGDEFGRDMRRVVSHGAKKGKKGPRGKEPEELRKYRLMDLAYFSRLRQDPLFAGDPTDPRGFMDIAREGLQRVYRIGLNPTADLSTFLHESGHLFLEIQAMMSERPDAPERVRRDFAEVLKWFGVEKKEDIKTEHHEKYARAFEAYLMEGKAPAARMVGVFERFKLWMKSVYKSIASLNVELSPAIRGVFDRLMATDAEIEQGVRDMGLAPLFRSPDEAGMNPEQWQAYLEAQERATSHAVQQADFRAAKDKLREQESWWKEEEAKAKQFFDEAYDKLPARLAQQLLRGQQAGDFLGIKVPLDRAAVEEMIGAEAGKKFRLAKEGAHPDEIADMLGFPTGKALLESVLQLPERDAWVNERAAQQMQEQHPDILEDRRALKELVSKGLHGDFTAEWLLKEWAALRAHGSKENPKQPPIEAIKRAAEVMAAGRQLGKLGANGALRGERRAAELAAKAAAKGEYAQAAVFKQQQLLNMFLFRELQKAQDELDSFLGLSQQLAKPAAEKRLGKADPVYRDAVRMVLENFGLKKVPDGEDAIRMDLGVVSARLEEYGATVAFDIEKLNQLLSDKEWADWKKLRVDEMRVVSDFLKNVRAAARVQTTVMTELGRMDREEAIAQLLADAAKNLPPMPALPSSESAASLSQAAGGLWNKYSGSLLKPSLLLEWLGNKNPDSPWNKLLLQPLQRAKHREVDLLKNTITPIIEAFRKVPDEVRKRFNEKIDGAKLFPGHNVSGEQELSPPTRRFELLMMTLNAGNESNLERLLEGRGITEQQLIAAINTLSKEELEWVQSVWDAAESLWPEAKALEERDSGVAPPKIERKPLVTVHGTFAGGYFPAMYDRRVEPVGEKQAASTIASLMDASYTRPGTAKSHLKNRVKGFTGVISLEPAAISAHLAQVAHDIAFREALKSVGSLVLDPQIQSTLKNRLGDGRATQFLQWLKDIGNQRGVQSDIHAAALTKLFRKLKANTVIGVMGYSVPTALGDFSNLLVVPLGSDLKAKFLASGFGSVLMQPKAAMEEALAKSGELRFRRGEVQRDLVKQLRTLTRDPKWKALDIIRDHAFGLFEMVDRMTATPIWLGAYRQALAAGKDEKTAINAADALIQKFFPSHSAVDTAPVLRDQKVVGAMLMFFGYFSTLGNVEADLFHDLTKKDASLKDRAIASGRMLGVLIAAGLFAELLSGRGPEAEDGEDEDEKWATWFARKNLATAFSLVPFGGEIFNSVVEPLLFKRAQRNPRNQSLVGVAAGIGIAAGKLAKAAYEDEDIEKKQVVALLQAIAPVTGVPTSQPVRTFGYLYDLLFGDAVARNPADIVSGLVYGEREKQPLNLPKAVGNALGGE